MANALAMTKVPQNNIEVSQLRTPNDLAPEKIDAIAEALNPLVADAIALWLKTKNYHWHMSGRNFRDYHLLLDEQSAEILATVDPLAERVRKLGRETVTSIGHVGRLQGVRDEDRAEIPPRELLLDLMEENKSMAAKMREAHGLCDENRDVATASLLEEYVNQTEERTWFLFEATRGLE